MKPLVFKTPPNILDPSVRFDVNKFDKLIWDKGYQCEVEKAMRCPCLNKGTGQAIPSCKNCLGLGWFFINKRETLIVFQGMGYNKKQEQWGESSNGTASVTLRGIDRLTYMDKIKVLDLEAYYQQVLRPVVQKNKAVAFPVYEPLEIMAIFEFKDKDSKLIPLKKEDWLIDGNRIIFSDKIKDKIVNKKEPTISIRYSHHPVYHMEEFNRDMMSAKSRNCATEGLDKMQQMPVHGTARKAHYIWQNIKTEADELFDNTYVFNKDNP